MTQIFWKGSLRKGPVDKPMNISPREPVHFLLQGLIKLLKQPHLKILINFVIVKFQRMLRKIAVTTEDPLKSIVCIKHNEIDDIYIYNTTRLPQS